MSRPFTETDKIYIYIMLIYVILIFVLFTFISLINSLQDLLNLLKYPKNLSKYKLSKYLKSIKYYS